MVEINKKLVGALERSDTRALHLEKKVGTLKKFRKLVKYAEEISCRVSIVLITNTISYSYATNQQKEICLKIMSFCVCKVLWILQSQRLNLK